MFQQTGENMPENEDLESAYFNPILISAFILNHNKIQVIHLEQMPDKTTSNPYP